MTLMSFAYGGGKRDKNSSANILQIGQFFAVSKEISQIGSTCPDGRAGGWQFPPKPARNEACHDFERQRQSPNECCEKTKRACEEQILLQALFLTSFECRRAKIRLGSRAGSYRMLARSELELRDVHVLIFSPRPLFDSHERVNHHV